MKINSYLIIVLLLAVSVAILVFVPQFQVANYQKAIPLEIIEKLNPNERVQLQKNFADIENNFRMTFVQIISSSLLFLSIYLTYRNVKISQENIRLAEEGKLTDRFGKAVELLGDEKLEIRLGGIYALERISRDSQRDHWTVVEILTAFVRKNSGQVSSETIYEISAVMNVISRRSWTETELPGTLDLRKVHLEKCAIYRANLNYVRFNGANLKGIFLILAKLHKTDFREADLSESDLSRADLSVADLRAANLKGANLSSSCLSKANLREADLHLTTLKNADLTEADLTTSKNITLEQILTAQNFEAAKLSPQLKKALNKYLRTEK